MLAGRCVIQQLPPLVLCRPFKRGQRRADPDTLQIRVAQEVLAISWAETAPPSAAASAVTANRENLHPLLIAYLRQMTRQRLPVAARFNHAGRKNRDPTREFRPLPQQARGTVAGTGGSAADFGLVVLGEDGVEPGAD